MILTGRSEVTIPPFIPFLCWLQGLTMTGAMTDTYLLTKLDLKVICQPFAHYSFLFRGCNPL